MLPHQSSKGETPTALGTSAITTSECQLNRFGRASIPRIIRIASSASRLSGASRWRGGLRLARLPILVEADVVRWHVRQNRAAELQNIDGAEILVEHLAVRIEQNRVGHRRLPGGIKRLLQRFRVG